jgi:hypothetical protein
MVMFAGLVALTPIWLLPLATGVAWPTPRGVWDNWSLALRPMAWSIVLFIPLTFAFLAFNVSGWEDFDKVIVERRVYDLRRLRGCGRRNRGRYHARYRPFLRRGLAHTTRR